MKIVTFTSSPRSESNSSILAEYVVKEALINNSSATVTTINLSNLNIPYCKACFKCHNEIKGKCFESEKFNELSAVIFESDILVFASPIYFFDISGQMKVFLDHWNAISEQPLLDKLKNKKAVLVFTYYDTNIEDSGVMNAIRTFQDAFRFIGIDYVGSVFTAISSTESLEEDYPTIVKQAIELGKKI